MPALQTNPPRPASVAQFTILVDGLCHLCSKESAMLKRMDKGRGRLAIVDIADPDFNPADYGRTMDELMGQIHGVTETGELITGVEVFRQAYRAVGWNWLLAWTRLPVISFLAEAVYLGFAWLRLRLPRMKAADSCTTGRCRLPRASTGSG